MVKQPYGCFVSRVVRRLVVVRRPGVVPVFRCVLFSALLVSVFPAVAAEATSAPLVVGATNSKAVFQKNATAARFFITDIELGASGTVMRGRSKTALPAGRYRLHIPLAMAPLGDLKVSAVNITLAVGKAERVLGTLAFTREDEFIDAALEFSTTEEERVEFSVRWALGKAAGRNKVRAVDASKLDPDQDGSEINVEGEAPVADEAGTVAAKDLGKNKYHIAAGEAHIEALAPITLSVTTDKIVYAPDQNGRGVISLKNISAQPQTLELETQVMHGLTAAQAVDKQKIAIAGGESKTIQIPFSAKGLYWGAALRVTARNGDGLEASADSIFGVSRNIWETAIVAGMMFTESYKSVEATNQKVAEWRQNGYTAFEAFFWAPDDFGDFTPDEEDFLGGQTQYRGSVSGTKNLIAAAHRAGIAATVYSNLWGGDGESGYEMMRRHPDWFSGASFSSQWLEMWPMIERKKMSECLWASTTIDEKNSEEALQMHADEFIASHRQFGWDATRYDSYYTSEWTKMATAKVRARVEKTLPNYQFGYNSFITNDAQGKALDIMVGNGGLAMEESVRSIGKKPESISRYAATLATLRDLLWPHGGHFGVCYDVPRPKVDAMTLDEIYLSSILLATGSHPYYSRMETGIGQYPRFALRYSEFIYNNAMRPLKTPETVIRFGGQPKLLEWKRLARTVKLGDGRHRLVIHLLNEPVDDLSLNNFAAKTPAALRDLPISLKLPADAKVQGAWLLGAIPDAHHESLKVETAGADTKLTVPEVRFWNVVVVDYTAKEGLQ